MPHPDHARPIRSLAKRRGRRLGQGKPRFEVVQDQNIVAESFLDQCFSIGLVGQRQNSVGVTVIDEFGRKERMHQGFDGRDLGPGIQPVGHELVHHLPVVKLIQTLKADQVAQVQSRMSLGLDPSQVVPGGLHHEGGDPVLQQIPDPGLDRGVAASVKHEGRRPPQEARSIRSQRQVPAPAASVPSDEPLGLLVGPTALHVPCSVCSGPSRPQRPPGGIGSLVPSRWKNRSASSRRQKVRPRPDFPLSGPGRARRPGWVSVGCGPLGGSP